MTTLCFDMAAQHYPIGQDQLQIGRDSGSTAVPSHGSPRRAPPKEDSNTALGLASDPRGIGPDGPGLGFAAVILPLSTGTIDYSKW